MAAGMKRFPLGIGGKTDRLKYALLLLLFDGRLCKF